MRLRVSCRGGAWGDAPPTSPARADAARGPVEEALLLADSVSVMTARPGRIKKRIAVELPRPRLLEVTTSPRFNELKREVLALIREESLRAAAE